MADNSLSATLDLIPLEHIQYEIDALVVACTVDAVTGLPLDDLAQLNQLCGQLTGRQQALHALPISPYGLYQPLLQWVSSAGFDRLAAQVLYTRYAEFVRSFRPVYRHLVKRLSSHLPPGGVPLLPGPKDPVDAAIAELQRMLAEASPTLKRRVQASLLGLLQDSVSHV